jgi:hypothetical protein
MRVVVVIGLVLALLAVSVAASFAIAASRGEHENNASGAQRSATGEKVARNTLPARRPTNEGQAKPPWRC